MKILMLTDYFPPHLGGGSEQAAYEVGRRLAARGHTVHVVTLQTVPAPARERLHGITVHRARALQLTRLLRLQSSVSLEVVALAAEVTRALRPDLLHIHNLFFYTSLVAAGLKARSGQPLVNTMHLGSMEQLGGLAGAVTTAYERAVGRAILRRSDFVIAVSQAVRRHAIGLGYPATRIEVIPNGVDLETFRPPPREAVRAGRPRVAFVGRLLFNKGPQYLVAAAPLVLGRHPDTEFVIIGDGPLRPRLEQAVARQGLAGAFRFLGMRSDVPALLGDPTLSLFVRPSLSEGLPLTVLEAMACGLPVVATPVGGTAEVVRDDETGYLVPPRAVEPLAAAICRLLDDPVHARALGANGRALVEREYSWERIAERTVAVYERVLARA
jgi:glycosyltransferase involved in cell wall biosynthesis